LIESRRFPGIKPFSWLAPKRATKQLVRDIQCVLTSWTT
jgi:hypothetical protein